jgi:hypothetical protein
MARKSLRLGERRSSTSGMFNRPKLGRQTADLGNVLAADAGQPVREQLSR